MKISEAATKEAGQDISFFNFWSTCCKESLPYNMAKSWKIPKLCYSSWGFPHNDVIFGSNWKKFKMKWLWRNCFWSRYLCLKFYWQGAKQKTLQPKHHITHYHCRSSWETTVWQFYSKLWITAPRRKTFRKNTAIWHQSNKSSL